MKLHNVAGNRGVAAMFVPGRREKRMDPRQLHEGQCLVSRDTVIKLKCLP